MDTASYVNHLPPWEILLGFVELPEDNHFGTRFAATDDWVVRWEHPCWRWQVSWRFSPGDGQNATTGTKMSVEKLRFFLTPKVAMCVMHVSHEKKTGQTSDRHGFHHGFHHGFWILFSLDQSRNCYYPLEFGE